MLRNQGVSHEPQKNVIAPSSKKSTDHSTLKLMESEKFKRLLQSRNQKDIEAANLMIQNMVRDNDRRSQIQNRRLRDLQSANENCILLKQMLDEFDPNDTSDDMLSTLQEIFNHLIKLRPTVARLAEDSYDSESFSSKIQDTSDAIHEAIELYTAIIINKSIVPIKKPKDTSIKTTNLLDVSEAQQPSNSKETFSELNDIFSNPTNSLQQENILLTPSQASTQQPTTNIDIIALINKHKPSTTNDDLLGNFNLNSPAKKQPVITNNNNSTNEKAKPLSELDSIISGMKTKLLNVEDVEDVKEKDIEDDVENLIIEEKVEEIIEEIPIVEQKIALKDINIDISEIQPSETEAPRTILDEKKGLKVVVNFTQGNPAKDVIVLVITVINQGPIAINNFQFDASVSKPCKLRILEASDTKLPGVKPFKPPTETINQVLLLMNPTQNPINMIAILTYNLQDDPDPYKESIEVKDIPFS